MGRTHPRRKLVRKNANSRIGVRKAGPSAAAPMSRRGCVRMARAALPASRSRKTILREATPSLRACCPERPSRCRGRVRRCGSARGSIFMPAAERDRDRQTDRQTQRERERFQYYKRNNGKGKWTTKTRSVQLHLLALHAKSCLASRCPALSLQPSFLYCAGPAACAQGAIHKLNIA